VNWIAEAIRRAEPVRRIAVCPVNGGDGKESHPSTEPKRSPAGKPDAMRWFPTPPHASQRHFPVPIPLAPGARAMRTMVCSIAIVPWHVRISPAMSRISAMRNEAQAMATIATLSAPFLAPSSLSGAARFLMPQRGSGPLLHALRAASYLEAAMSDSTRPTPPTSPASWSTP
jgi:hypothetical protein